MLAPVGIELGHMSKAAQRKNSLILVTEHYDPAAWQTLENGETETQAWLAVAQDLWGHGCFGPGQLDGLRQGANGLTITKKMIVGVIGGALSGVEAVAADNDAYIDVIDCDPHVSAHRMHGGGGEKLLKPLPWNPQQPELQADRYHALIASRALAMAEDFVPIVKALALAVKPSGQLYVDEIHAADASVAALVAQSIAAPDQKLRLHPHDTVMQALKHEAFELRSSVSANEPLMDELRRGLTRAQDVAQLLKTIPQPFRKQRMLAFTNELQRAAVLYQAIEKGLVTSTRSIFRKPREL